jgi:hypothetical protein
MTWKQHSLTFGQKETSSALTKEGNQDGNRHLTSNTSPGNNPRDTHPLESTGMTPKDWNTVMLPHHTRTYSDSIQDSADLGPSSSGTYSPF